MTAVQKKTFFRRRKVCPFSGEDSPAIDYKDVKMLRRFISERGKMMPSRITNVSQKKQRELSLAIKRARMLALLPFVVEKPVSTRVRPSATQSRR